MPTDQARRGRPKGSGLDDTDHLRRVARMLEADPELKPTTAIKAIGISDPSTIRRLRDKLRGTSAGEDEAINSSGKFERGAGSETETARRRDHGSPASSCARFPRAERHRRTCRLPQKQKRRCWRRAKLRGTLPSPGLPPGAALACMPSRRQSRRRWPYWKVF